MKQYILSDKEIAKELIRASKKPKNELKRVSTASALISSTKQLIKKADDYYINDKLDKHIKKNQLVLEKLMIDRAHAQKSMRQVL